MEHGASTGMISTWTLELILLKARYHATEKVELDSSIRRNHIGETYMDTTLSAASFYMGINLIPICHG